MVFLSKKAMIFSLLLLLVCVISITTSLNAEGTVKETTCSELKSDVNLCLDLEDIAMINCGYYAGNFADGYCAASGGCSLDQWWAALDAAWYHCLDGGATGGPGEGPNMQRL